LLACYANLYPLFRWRNTLLIIWLCARACEQAKFQCTTSRAKKVISVLIVGALIVEAVNTVCRRMADVWTVRVTIYAFRAIMPIAVLVINAVVAVQVRRAASNAAANLGVQSHHQSTSSNSAVPAVMLIATSLMYVFFYGMHSILVVLWWWAGQSGFTQKTEDVLGKCLQAALSVARLVFAYNFYVYLITGKQFRFELHELFSRRRSSL